MQRRQFEVIASLSLVAGLFSPTFGQKPAFDFFPDFRNVFTVTVRADNPSVTNDGILERYASSLKAEGVTDTEIARRIKLIRTERRTFEAAARVHRHSDEISVIRPLTA